MFGGKQFENASENECCVLSSGLVFIGVHVPEHRRHLQQ